MPSYTHKMAHVSWPEILWRHFALCVPVENNFHGFFLLPACLCAEICALLRCSTVVTDVTFWRMAVNWNISVRFSKYREWCFWNFYFSTTNVQFSVELFFSVARLSTVCIYALLFCCACSGMAWQWKWPNGNPTGMGIRLKPGNGNSA